jgi:hypothetical protein
MFKRLQNTFISFSVIFQGFQRRNPKYRGDNFKGVGRLHGLDE